MSSAASHRDIKHLLRRAGERSANGCAQCRKRKVKCDEQKPTCADCKRLRLTCTWSQRPWKFVHVNDRVSRRYEVSSGPPRNHSQQSSDPIKLDPIEFIPSRHYRVRSRAQETESLVCSSASTSTSGPSPKSRQSTTPQAQFRALTSSKRTEIPPTVDPGPTTRSQMLIAALNHYISPNESQGHRGEYESPRLTFLNLSNDAIFNPRAPFLAAAIDSFTLVQASLALGDNRLGFAAIRRYSACLLAFNTALANYHLYHHDDILLCILVLSILESMRPISQFGGWASHVQGLIKYLQSRGPRRLETRYQTVLFHHAKQASILWGISCQQSIPFGGKDWLRVSRSAPLVNHQTRLIDLGTKIPGLLAPSNRLSNPTNMSEYRTYFLELLTTSAEIQAWISEFYQERVILVYACSEINFPTYHRLVQSNMLDTALRFQNFNDAWYISTAWTYLYLIQTTCLALMLSEQPLQVDADPKSLAISVELIVDNLSKTVPQALSSEAGFSGRMSLNLFLRMLTLHYEAQKRHEMVRWCQGIEGALYTPDQGHAGAWMANWEGLIELPQIAQLEKL